MKNTFNKTLRALFENGPKQPFLKEGDEKKIFQCPHRRRHLIRTKKGVVVGLFCKDSKVIYKIGRKIKVSPVTVNDCRRCKGKKF